MSTETIPLKRRLMVVGGYFIVTFLIGSLIFYFMAEGEVRKYYLLVIGLFPGGFVILGLGKASAPVGWAAYALCIAAMLLFARRNAFLLTCGVFTVLILVNLFGCAVSLKG